VKRIISALAAAALILSGCASGGLSKSDKAVIAGVGAVAVGAAATLALSARSQHAEHQAHMASTCGDAPRSSVSMDAADWYIGPTLWDGNHSPGMSLHPRPHPSGTGFVIDFPSEPGQKVDYVTTRLDGLAGKTSIEIEYELTLDPGVEVNAVPEPDKGDTGHYLAQITPHFQQAGDDWSAGGKYESMRWYFVRGSQGYLQPGVHTIIAPLTAGWTATQTSTQDNNPAGFRAAIEHAQCIGIVFGGNGIGIGHGANATGHASAWIKRFEIR